MIAPRRNDLFFGLFWSVLGFAIVVESWRMDRLEAQGINPLTVPSLVPGLLGATLVLLGVVLAVRAGRGVVHTGNIMDVEPTADPGADTGADPGAEPGSAVPQSVTEPWRVGLALLLCIGFAGGLVGHGLPFWLAAFAFVFLAITLFEWPDRRAAGTLLLGAIHAAVIAGCAAAAITLVFQELFLVRLP